MLKHPLFITIITFVFTGVLASTYQNYLVNRIKQQEIDATHLEKQKELDTSRQQRASDAVKEVTDLLYERVYKGSMVVSSVKRQLPLTK